MKRERLTAKEHIALGLMLKRVHRELLHIGMVVQDAYGKGEGAKVFKVERKVAALRYLMEAKLNEDYPMPIMEVGGKAFLDVYWGSDEGALTYYGMDGAQRFRADLVEGGSERADEPRKRMEAAE